MPRTKRHKTLPEKFKSLLNLDRFPKVHRLEKARTKADDKLIRCGNLLYIVTSEPSFFDNLPN